MRHSLRMTITHNVIALLLHLTTLTSAELPDILQPGPVHGLVGEDLILPCSLKNSVSQKGLVVQYIIDGEKLVHHYANNVDVTSNQLLEYHNRTSLFRDELQRGNISLKLSSVRLSDTNTYTCYVRTLGGTDKKSFNVSIESIGSQPNISVESHKNGSITLECKSEGWYPQPIVEWLNSKGGTLPSDSTKSNSTAKGFMVIKRVTIQESDGVNFTCRVSHPRQTKEMKHSVSGADFAVSRQRHWIVLALIPCFAVITIIIGIRSRGSAADVYTYKDWVKCTFREIPIENSIDGEHMLLDEQYIDLLIAETMVESQEKKKDFRRRLDSLEQVPSQKNFPGITVQELFRPNRNGCVPNLVVLQGESGLGKSVTAKKILYDWACGTLFSDRFDLVLLLKCDELNQKVMSEKTLVELVTGPDKFRQVIEYSLKSSADKVLFIVDGFDELSFSGEEAGHPGNIVCSMLNRQVDFYVLITTRSLTSHRLDKMIEKHETTKTRCTEILGFSENGVKKYFETFFKNDHIMSENAFKYIKGNEMLFSSCCIPVICWIVCTVLKNKSEGVNMTTTTSIFVHVVSNLLEHHICDKSKFFKLLDGLGKLAELGIENNKVLFEKRELSDISANFSPDKNPFLRKLHLLKKHIFIHLSFQEFFSALRYIMMDDAEAERKVNKLLKSVQAEPQNPHPEPHYLSVIRFLFGLSNHEVSGREKLVAPEDAHVFQGSLVNILKDWLHEKVNKSYKEILFLMHCLYELHENEFSQTAMKNVKSIDLHNNPLKWRDCSVLRYCLECCNSIAQLNLKRCNLTTEGLELLKPMLSKLHCKDLKFDVDGLNEDDAKEFLQKAADLIRPQLEQYSECDGSGSAQPQGKSVSICLAFMKSISGPTVSNIFEIFKNSKIMLELSAEVDKLGYKKETSICSNLTLRRDDESFMLSVGHENSTSSSSSPAISLITLTMKAAKDLTANWTDFLLSPAISNDGVEEKLMSFLGSLKHLMKVELAVNCFSEDWVERILTFMKSYPDPLDLRIWTSERKDSLCSSLSLTKEDSNYRLTVTCSSSQISCTLPRVTSSELIQFLKSFQSLEVVPDKTRSNQHETDLLSLLPGLGNLRLKVEHLNDNWTNRIFSFVKTHSRDKELTVWVEAQAGLNSAEDNLCSMLSVEIDKSSFRLMADKTFCSSRDHSPPLSQISVLLDSNSLEMEWVIFLNTFHALSQCTDSSDLDVKDLVGKLLSFLGPLTPLREVSLWVNCLNKMWAESIIELIDTCCTLQKVTLSARYNSNTMSVIEYGPIETQAIEILRSSKKRDNCTIVLGGIKTSTPHGLSHQSTDQLRPFIFTIEGTSLRQRPL